MPIPIPREACFDVPRWHQKLWAEHASSAPEAKRVAQVGDAKAAGFSDGYLPELHHRLYSASPAEVPADKRGSASAVRAKLHQLAGELPEFETLRKQTVGDPLWAGMATSVLGDSVASALPERKDEAAPPDAERANRILDGLKDMLADGVASPEDVGRAAGEAFSAAEATEAAAGGLDEAAVRQALRRGVEAAQEAVDEAQQAAAAFGYGPGGGAGDKLPPNVAMQLAKKVRNSDKLRQIMALAGRLSATARAKRATKSDYARSELVGVEPTGDIARLLPSELGAFGHAVRTVDLLRRVTERSAMGYKVRGKDKSARGPIVIGIDISGSMSGDKDVWAKAVALALLDTARAEKRAFAVVTFNGQVVDTFTAVDPHNVDVLALLDVLSREPFGGTDFDVPVLAALDFIEAQPVFKKADVILVTDAIARKDSSGATKKRADGLGATVYGILIGHGGEDTLKSWCHEVARIDDVSRDTAAVDLVFDRV